MLKFTDPALQQQAADDLETLKKQNIGQAEKQLQKYIGTTPFVVSYVTQMALGGHSIPINHGLLTAMQVVGVISENEAQKGLIPGLERAIPKNKGVEYGSLLHQLGVELGRNPYGPTTRKLLLEIAPGCKDQLPKRLSKRAAEEEAAAAAAAAAEAAQKAAAAAQRKSKKDAKSAAKASAGKPATKLPYRDATGNSPIVLNALKCGHWRPSAMTPLTTTETIPLATDTDGVIRVGKARVTLDTIVMAFADGATAEEIVQQYPSVPLADVYYVIGYYLRRQGEVEAYLDRRRQQAAEIRKQNESRFDPAGIRGRLLARRASGRL